ncbi:MAG: S8 family serine peptidase [Planctomycetota bacterium]
MNVRLFAATLASTCLSMLAVAQKADSTANPAVGLPHELVLKFGSFDPVRGLPIVPASLAAADDVNLWVVQFRARPDDVGRAAVRSVGATLFGYLPHDAYVVRMSSDAARAAAGLPMVRFVGRYEPSWRLEPALFAALVRGDDLPKQKYNVVVTDKRFDKPELARHVEGIGGRVVDRQESSILFVVELTAAQLALASRFDEVLWIDRWSAPELDMNNARIQGGANYVETMAGYTGQGVRGHVYEGLEFNHPDFTTPFTNVLSGGGADDHGHCTAGIVFGNGTSSPIARGMAPNAQGFFTQYSTAQQARNATIGVVVNTYQCMFTTASWGDALTTAYNSISADADDIIFDHRIPWTQSQSNAHTQSSRPQAWAKNIFSIGAVQHFDNSNPNDDSWAAGGGSTGLAADGRIKPDLCAYYDSIACSDRSGAAGYSATNWFSGFGGTSGATPICAGHNAIAIQMYTDGILGNPLNVPGGTRFQNRPLAQTLKALQIVSARQYPFTASSTDNRRNQVGWGFPNLQDMYDNRGFFYVVPEDDVLTQGTQRTHVINVPAGESELKICMTFVDPAGNPASTLAAVNDLSLRVTAPNGTIYWGNNGLTAGNYSTAGGSANTYDTVECVFVPNPAAGAWTVDVFATLIAQDANVSTSQIDATYALCCVPAAPAGGGPRARFTAYGSGCAPIGTPAVPRTFYEQFGSFDLASSARRFTPNGSGGWNVSVVQNGFIGGATNNLLLGDDTITRNRALGFTFPLAGGGSTTAIDIDSNGWIGLVANQHAGSDYTESVSEFLANPARIAVMWDDLNPGAAGGVYFDTQPGVAIVTWLNVPEYSNTGSNTAQLQLYPDGSFILAYQGMTIADCMVGYSVGNGVTDPGPSDISNPSAGTPIGFSASAPPRLGTTINLETSNIPVGAVGALAMLGFGQQAIDLSSVGMAGCTLLTQISQSSPMTINGSSATFSLSIPNVASLAGAIVDSQSLVVAPGANTLGVLASNGGELLLGN